MSTQIIARAEAGTPDIFDKDQALTQVEDTGVGKKSVSALWIIGITLYFLMFSALLLIGLLMMWPSVGGGVGAVQSGKTGIFSLPANVSVSMEARMFAVVALAGALGSQIHVLRSFYWYVGQRALVWSWMLKYLLLPFVGAFLGLAFYIVVRGGFVSPGADLTQINPYGYAAVATLVGLFSEQAVEKLRTVAATIFTEAPQGKDTAPPQPTPQSGSASGNNNTNAAIRVTATDEAGREEIAQVIASGEQSAVTGVAVQPQKEEK